MYCFHGRKLIMAEHNLQMSYELTEDQTSTYQVRIVKKEVEMCRCTALSLQEWQQYISLILHDFTRRDLERGLGVAQSGINTVLIPRSQTSMHNSASVQQHIDLYNQGEVHFPASRTSRFWKTASDWLSPIQRETVKYKMAQPAFFIPFQMLPTTWEGGLVLRLVLVDVGAVAELAADVRHLLAAGRLPGSSSMHTNCTSWPGVVVQGMINVDDLRKCTQEPNWVRVCNCPECAFGLQLVHNWVRNDSERMSIAEGYLCDFDIIQTEHSRGFTRDIGTRHEKCMAVDAVAQTELTNLPQLSACNSSSTTNMRRTLPFALDDCSTDTLRFLVLAVSHDHSVVAVDFNTNHDQGAPAYDYDTSSTLSWLLTNPPILSPLSPTLVAPWLLLRDSRLVALPALEHGIELQPDCAFVPATRRNCLHLCRKLLEM